MIKLVHILSETVIEPHWYIGPNPASNIVVVKKFSGGYKILLVKRGGPTEHGKWSLPGGYQNTTSIPKAGNQWKPGKETAEQTAIRELKEETNLDASILKNQLKLIQTRKGANPNNTEDSWVWLSSFALLLPDNFDVSKTKGLDDAIGAKWFADIADVEPLAFKDKDTIAKGLGLLFH